MPHHLLRPDERYGFTTEPGAVGVSVATGREVTYRINGAGLRDEPVPLAPTPGIHRIVLLGGDAAFGAGVALDDHFSVAVERDLEQVEIANLAVPGFSPGQMLLRLRAEGLVLAPDLVLAFVDELPGEGTTGGPLARRERPRFEVAPEGVVLAHAPQPGSGAFARLGGRIERWLERHSSAYHVIGDALRGVHAGGHSRSFSPAAGRAPAPTPSPRALALAEALVLAMRDEAAAAGTSFLLVTRDDALHAAAHARGVTSLDVTELLANPMFQLPGTGGRIDARGNRALACTLTAFLRESGLIAPQHWRAL
ncbi:MAG: hypothetical protein QF410_09425 [Planctomycetota bacterium]|nr:hypothetical protein [Planctomycetota bacterium]